MQPGTDQKGSFYSSIEAMWQSEINHKKKTEINSNQPEQRTTAQVVNPIGSTSNWYSRANSYWKASESTYDGVLSGYGKLSGIDIAGSLRFLSSYLTNKIKNNFVPHRVLDCGAGIGRIANEMLCSIFNTVDVVDQCEKYIEKAKQILKDKKIGHFYAKGLQQFQFEEKYDCVWVQWVLSHLTDDDAVQFLKKAKKSLNEEGFIVVKENCCGQGFLVDKQDCSVSRSDELYKKIFQKAELKIVKQEMQQNWPKDLLDVKMYLLQ